MIKIVPMFVQNLISLNAKIPHITMFIINISVFIKNNIVLMLSLNTILFIVGLLSKKTKISKMARDYSKLNMPIFRKIYKNILTARFARFMSILLNSGLNIVKALDIVSHTIGNNIVEKKLQLSIDDIKKGKAVWSSISKISMFDPLLMSMVLIGEEAGELDEMLLKTADIFEDEVYENIEKLITFIEPVMIIFLAVIVGSIIIAIVLPMVSIMNSIGN